MLGLVVRLVGAAAPQARIGGGLPSVCSSCAIAPLTHYLQALLHELDKIQGEARAAAARAEAADAEVQAREQLLAAARVSATGAACHGWVQAVVHQLHCR